MDEDDVLCLDCGAPIDDDTPDDLCPVCSDEED